MGAKSRTILLVVNLLAAILALAIVGITLNALYNKVGQTIPQLQGLPIEIYYSFIVFGAFVFFVSILGVIGTCIHSKVFLSLFVIFDILLALAFLVIAIFALIYSNGISTVSQIDSNAQKFQALIEKNLYEQATKKPEVWNVTQVTLGCCGVDLESTYANITELGVASLPAFLDILQPGEACAAGRNAVVSIHGSFSSYSADAEAAADANSALTNYFCKDVISSFLAKNTLYAGIISAVLVLIMISTAASAIILMTKVTTVNGGFVPPPAESGNSLAYGASKKGGPQVNSVSVGNTLA